MSSLSEDLERGSAWIAEALNWSGYTADFTPGSLWEVDRFFDEHASGGKPQRGGLLADATGGRLFALGAYIGDVLKQGLGATWVTDDDEPEGEMNVALELSDGSVVWAVQRAMQRL